MKSLCLHTLFAQDPVLFSWVRRFSDVLSVSGGNNAIAD